MEGSSPYIELELDAAPRITNFTWTKDNVEITSTPCLILGVNTLKFNPVSRQDSGQYLITANDELGSGNATISLDVYCKYYNTCSIIEQYNENSYTCK